MLEIVGLVCSLALVAIIGHGLWLAAAALVNIAQGADPRSTGARLGRATCPRCGLMKNTSACLACGWPAPISQSVRHPEIALDAVCQQIDQLVSAEVLNVKAARELLESIAERRSALCAPGIKGPSPAELSDRARFEKPMPAEVIQDAPSIAVPPPPKPAIPPVQRPPATQSAIERKAQMPAPTKVSDWRDQFPDVVESQSSPRARRSFSDWLAAFMEERNIRWGELVGGMLIVCCSIALVISFWAEIAEKPLLKFLVFNGVTASLFGIGFYSEHRWRLHTSSQGLLLIGSLLVPLNFLAIAAFTTSPTATDWRVLGGEAFSALLFAAIVYCASRTLLHSGAAIMAVAVMVPSLTQLLVRRFVDGPADPALLAEMGALPAGCYLACNFLAVRGAASGAPPSERCVNDLFKLLGVSTFAALVPLALMLFKTAQPMQSLHEVPGLILVLSFVPLASGLFLWQRLSLTTLTALRTAGGALAVFGALASLAALVVAWPHAGAMFGVALLEFVVFSYVAGRYDVSAAHVLAGACLALAYLLGVNLASGHIDWASESTEVLLQVLVRGRNGLLLAPLVLGYAAAALRVGRESSTGRMLGLVSGAIAACSLALTSWFGFGVAGDPERATWVYLVYAAASLAGAALGRRPLLAWLGAGLLLAATFQGIVYGGWPTFDLVDPRATAILTYTTITLALFLALRWSTREENPAAGVLRQASLAALSFSVAHLAWLAPWQEFAFEAEHWLWIVGLSLAWAMATGWPLLWTLVQISLTAAILFGVAAQLESQTWFAESPRRWLEPWTLSAMGIALGAFSLTWAALRLVARRVKAASHPANQLLDSPYLICDRLTTCVAAGLLLYLGTYAALPGVRQELSLPQQPIVAQQPVAANAQATTPERYVPPIEEFELRGLPHEHAGGWPTWVLLLVVAGTLGITAATTRSQAWLMALGVSLTAGVPLLASRWEGEAAVASALRWISVGWFVVLSLPNWASAIWPRHGTASEVSSRRREGRALALLAGLVPMLAVLAPMAGAALQRSVSTVAFPDRWTMLAAITAALIVGISVSLDNAKPSWRRQILSLRPAWPESAGLFAISLGALPIVAATVYLMAVGFDALPILGPAPESAFTRMGLVNSYAVPIAVVAMVLIVYALVDRSSTLALAGGLAVNVATTTVYLLTPAGGIGAYTAAEWLRLLQWNVIAAALYSVGWLAVRRRAVRRDREARGDEFDWALGTQVALAPSLLALAFGWAWCTLVANPQGLGASPAVVNREFCDVWGGASLMLALGAACGATWLAGRRLSMAGASALLSSLAIPVAAIAARWDVGDWVAYNTLLSCHALAAVGMLAIVWSQRRALALAVRDESATSELPEMAHGLSGACWVTIQRLVVFALAMREFEHDLSWSAGAFAFLAVSAAALGWVCQRRRYLYDAAAMLNIAGTLAWVRWRGDDKFGVLYCLNVILLTLPAPLWLAIESKSIAKRAFAPLIRVAPVHRTAARIGLIAMGLWAAVGLAGDYQQSSLVTSLEPMPWIAVASVAMAALVLTWDRQAKDAIALLYSLGLVAVATLVAELNLGPSWLVWTGDLTLAAYTVLASYLWSRRAGLRQIADMLGVPTRGEGDGQLAWLVPCNLFLVGSVVFLTGVVELTNRDTSLRVLAAQAMLSQVLSVAMLARGDRRGALQTIALALGAASAAMFGWSWLEIDTTFTPLHALVVLVTAAAGMAVLYGFGLGKLLRDTSDWLLPARQMIAPLLVICGAALAGVFIIEWQQYDQHGSVEMARPAIAAIIATLIGLCSASLAAAIVPGRDPLGLSERERTVYVYAAEALLAIALAHVRLTMPWLFSGFFQRYWPVVVMAIAFAGVGFAEFCRRRRQNVLAAPLENTGVLLPVLPVMGFWALDSQVDYSLLLLSVGVLYAGLSIARRSFGFGVLATLAANGGLWYFLNRQEGWGFLVHPQVWLIPPAMCVLVAAYLNRRQLSDAQMTAVRYVSSMVIYLSSTADIFANGLAQAPYLPLVLGALAIVGIFTGILLHVRAFLYLGTLFLGMALFSIIWHAAVDLHQTWIWWASGIVAGVLILALFAAFEKKRLQILEVVDRVKQWNG